MFSYNEGVFGVIITNISYSNTIYLYSIFNFLMLFKFFLLHHMVNLSCYTLYALSIVPSSVQATYLSFNYGVRTVASGEKNAGYGVRRSR